MTAFSSSRSGVGPNDKWTDYYGTVLREAVDAADNQIRVAASDHFRAGDNLLIGAAYDSPVTKEIDSIEGTVITLTDNVGADFAVNSPVTALPSNSGYAPGGTDVAVADGGTGASTASGARTNLGLAIGTNVQGYDADLTAFAALSPANDDVLQRKSDAWTNRTMAQLIADLAALGTTFQPLDSDLTAIAALTTTSYGRGLLELADQAALLSGEASTINFVIDGGGATITTGVKGDLVVDFACTIVAWTALADQSGSIVVDIWKDTYANFPPTVADTITGAEKPTISTATKGQDTSLASGAGWAVSAGDVLRFNVDSITTCQRVTIALKVTRT